MANELTGDFDVVALFGLPAVNRVLAAMHRNQRFPHSISVRVDDRPARELAADVPTLVSIVDRYGEVIADPQRLVEASGRVRELVAQARAAGSDSAVDAIVNAGGAAPFDREALSERAVTGIAQVQLSAPTLELDGRSESRVIARTQMMVRYFPEPGSKPLPERMRGEIRTTADVDRVASQVGSVFELNMKTGAPTVVFAPAWGDPFPSAGQGQAIDQAVHKAITTAFVPTNAVLPPGRHLQFKTLPGARPAIGVLMNAEERESDPGTVQDVFLADGADFSYAAGRDYVIRRFTTLVDEALTARGLRQFSYSFQTVVRVAGVVLGRRTTTYDVTLGQVSIDLHDGVIRMTAHGRAETSGAFPSFSFRAEQDFALALDDATAELVRQGEVALHILTGGVEGWLANLFKGRASGAIAEWIDKALAEVRPAVRRMLSAQSNVGEAVGSLMSPTGAKGLPQTKDPGPDLTYTGYQIRAAGLVFQGTLEVAPWPAVHVDFDLTAWTAGTGIHEYSALKSWIPGGTVREYVWRLHGRPTPLSVDANTFFYSDAPTTGALIKASPFGFDREEVFAVAAAGGGNPRVANLGVGTLCLTVSGTRLSATGPVIEEAVSATACRMALGVTLMPERPLEGVDIRPYLAIVQAAERGGLEVVGHVSPWLETPTARRDRPNLLVHFAADGAPERVDALAEAVRLSGRTDSATAVLAVVPADALAGMRARDGIIVTDDPDGAWRRLLGAERAPATVLLRPTGEMAWRQEGDVQPDRLAAELRERLVGGGVVEPRFVPSPLRVGEAAPNFLFPHAPGREITLRRLVGRPAVLVFWRATSIPSLETLRRIADAPPGTGMETAVVLAIHDGEAADRAESAFAEAGIEAILVLDRGRDIARAYGVSVWPTTVVLDERGLVRSVQYGRPDPGRASTGRSAEPQVRS
jgi:peroxiredoxin